MTEYNSALSFRKGSAAITILSKMCLQNLVELKAIKLETFLKIEQTKETCEGQL